MGDKRKSGNPVWSDVKAAMAGMDGKELVSLVSDLYRLSGENQAFLHARFAIGGDPLEPYKNIIDDSMYPDVRRKQTIQIARGKHAISTYSKAAGDPRGEAELMVFFVECGNNFTLDYGDIDQAFYDALTLMYGKAITKVLGLPKDERHDFRERLKEIMTSSSRIGWGYHDTLCDEYYEGFAGDDE